MAESTDDSTKDLVELAEEATLRLYTDPVFAARVQLAVTCTDMATISGTDNHLTKREKTIAKVAASLALVITERDPATGERISG